MWRLSGGAARIRPHADALVAEGQLRRLEAEDGKAPVPSPRLPSRGALPLPVLFTFDNSSGTARSSSGSSAFDTHRGLQARTRARLRLLRPAAPPARPARGRADLQHAGEGVIREGVPSRARRPRQLDDCLDAALVRLARVLGAGQVVRS
jgi:hypothetical protein